MYYVLVLCSTLILSFKYVIQYFEMSFYLFFQIYQRHLTSRCVPNDDGGEIDKDAMGFDQMPEESAPTPAKRGRKRKNQEVDPDVSI